MFCPGCGAKVVKKRLTFKGLFADIAERVFNLENSFYRTLRDMTLRPEKVILKYVEGTRRRYMAPMNYLGLALALSGIAILAMRKFALDKLDLNFFDAGIKPETGDKLMNAVMEYNSIIFIMYIPVMAFAGWLTFNKRGHNIPEYTVTSIYVLSHISLLSFLPNLIITIGIPQFYMTYSFVFLGIMILYAIFVMVRTHQYKGIAILGRGLLFTIFFLVGYVGVSVLLDIVLILTGILDWKDFVPQMQDAQAVVSSAMNWASYSLW